MHIMSRLYARKTKSCIYMFALVETLEGVKLWVQSFDEDRSVGLALVPVWMRERWEYGAVTHEATRRYGRTARCVHEKELIPTVFFLLMPC